MTDSKVCPSCGATLDENVGSQCPFCGSALDAEASNAAPVDSGSAKTMISARPLSKEAQFGNSAEAMDEIKKQLAEGDEVEATRIAGQQFGLKPEDAKNTVEQVADDMKYNAGATMLAGHAVPPPPPPVAASAPYSTPAAAPASFSPPPPASVVQPAKPARNPWMIGGIAAVVFLCLCCCLPGIIMIAYNYKR